MTRFVPIAVMACALSGCAWLQDDRPAISLPRPSISANLVAPCENLTPLADGSGASVLRKLVEVSNSYYECARKHDALVQAAGQRNGDGG